MTAKDKAKELVDFYLKIISDVHPLVSYTNSAKQCALICVDNEIDLIMKLVSANELSVLFATELITSKEEVKQEINKL